jgi:hypothetical protein
VNLGIGQARFEHFPANRPGVFSSDVANFHHCGVEGITSSVARASVSGSASDGIT